MRSAEANVLTYKVVSPAFGLLATTVIGIDSLGAL